MKSNSAYQLLEYIEDVFSKMDEMSQVDAVNYGAHLAMVMQEQASSVLAYAKAGKETRQLVKNAVQSQKKVIKSNL